MPRLDNPRHEAFAQEIAKGSKGSPAYKKIYGENLTSARQNASVLLKDPDIKARVAELQSKSAEGVALTVREMHKYLREVVETPAGNIDENSRLCQKFKFTPETRELTIPDKLRALELSAKLSGLLKDKVEVDVSDDFGQFIGLIRRGSRDGSE